MRLTTILLIVSLMQVSAATLAQRITLNEKNASLDKVLKAIRQQSGYDILFDGQSVGREVKVNVKVQDVTVDEALKETLKGLALDYTINEKNITISKKQTGFLENIKAVLAAIDVHGRVVDEKGQPLAGATVKSKYTSIATLTDEHGDFFIKNINDSATVVISFIGYQPKEFIASVINGTIQLEPSLSPLDQVLIQAYGKTSQRLATGNITTINSQQIEKQPIDNPIYALQGRVPGLIVNPTSGLPGSNVDLQIRGGNSLSFATRPLIVIDNVPVINNVNGLSSSGAMGNISTLAFLNPNDIETISVLKDADATSIYGSRGANGVIIINTKKGKKDGTRIDLNIQHGWGKVSTRLDLMNTAEYLNYRKVGFQNSGIDFINSFPFNSPNTKYSYARELFVWSPYEDTDWQKILLGGTAQFDDLQGNISGGNSLLQFRLGGNYHRQTNVFPGSAQDKRGSFTSSIIGNTANQRLKVGLTTIYAFDQNILPGGNFTQQAVTLSPNAPHLYNSDGTLNWADSPLGGTSWPSGNPLAQLLNQYKGDVKNLTVTGNINYQFAKGLYLNMSSGYSQFNGEGFNPNYLSSNDPSQLLLYGQYYFASVVNKSTTSKSFSIDPNVEYRGQLNKHSIKLLLGGTYQTQDLSDQNIQAYGFRQDALIKNYSAANQYILDNTSSQYKYTGAFARIEYNYNEKYLLTINARRDGSSRFGPGNNFGFFGSVGAGWVFTNEDFFRNAKPIISFGKIRASYGTAGNDGIGDYQYLQRYLATGGGGTNSYQDAIGFSTTGNVNSNYHWESTRKLELGLEIGLFNDRIFLISDYYRNRSGNQLIQKTQPLTAGTGIPYINFPALLQNSGVEFSLKTINLKSKKISWSSSLTFAHNENKLIAFPDLANSFYSQTLEIGKPVAGLQKVYKFAGVDPTNGIYQFFSKNGSITQTPYDATQPFSGRYVNISTAPKFEGMLGNSLTLNRLNISFDFQFRKQIGINPVRDFISTGVPGLQSNLPKDFLNGWQKSGDAASSQKIISYYSASVPGVADIQNGYAYFLQSDAAYVDASFIRLKNIFVSYDLGSNFFKHIGIRSFKLNLQGQNIFTITKYKGLDPETQSIYSLPPLRVITTGIQASF